MLILGKQYTKNNPNKIGGIIMLFELLKKELFSKKIDFDVVDINWRNYKHWLYAYPVIFILIILKVPKHKHISLHGTANEFIYIGSFLVFYSKLLNKKISLRKPAGNFHIIYESGNPIKKGLIKYTLKSADIVFFETKYLVQYFKNFNKNTFWFPNVRSKSSFRTSNTFNKKFVFIGHISKEKGIQEILEIAYDLGEVTIDLYGPLVDFEEKELNIGNVHYKGILKSDEVLKILSSYDVLVLPSYREGYPGVVLEALSVGMPVIATALEGIKEIVANDSGILIEMKNSKELKKAILSFNDGNYTSFSSNALKEFENFDSDIQTKLFLDRINKI